MNFENRPIPKPFDPELPPDLSAPEQQASIGALREIAERRGAWALELGRGVFLQMDQYRMATAGKGPMPYEDLFAALVKDKEDERELLAGTFLDGMSRETNEGETELLSSVSREDVARAVEEMQASEFPEAVKLGFASNAKVADALLAEGGVGRLEGDALRVASEVLAPFFELKAGELAETFRKEYRGKYLAPAVEGLLMAYPDLDRAALESRAAQVRFEIVSPFANRMMFSSWDVAGGAYFPYDRKIEIPYHKLGTEMDRTANVTHETLHALSHSETPATGLEEATTLKVGSLEHLKERYAPALVDQLEIALTEAVTEELNGEVMRRSGFDVKESDLSYARLRRNLKAHLEKAGIPFAGLVKAYFDSDKDIRKLWEGHPDPDGAISDMMEGFLKQE